MHRQSAKRRCPEPRVRHARTNNRYRYGQTTTWRFFLHQYFRHLDMGQRPGHASGGAHHLHGQLRARCLGQDIKCTGTLVAGDRYRYLSLKARHEVIFWVAGSAEPSGKFTDCTVENRGNWSCKANVDSAKSITHEMVNDKAKPDPIGLTRPFHAVPKWEWWLLRVGFPGFSDAND